MISTLLPIMFYQIGQSLTSFDLLSPVDKCQKSSYVQSEERNLDVLQLECTSLPLPLQSLKRCLRMASEMLK